MAVIDVSQMYYTAYYSCTMMAEAAGPIRQLLCGDTTAKPLDPVDFMKSTLPNVKSRRLLRKEYFATHLRSCKREWKVFAKTWGTLRNGEGHWIKATHPNPLLALLRMQLDEWLLLWYRTGLWMEEPCNGKAAEKLTRRRQASAAEDGFGKGIRAPPPATTVLQEWWDGCRDWPAHVYAYAVPNDAAMTALKAYCTKVVEVGAGTGYWAAYMQASGIAIDAYDIAPPSSSSGDGKSNEYHGKTITFAAVNRGGVSVASASDADTLFLCYPPPDDEMALECLTRFRGKLIAYVGEWQGVTANAAFEDALLAGFDLLARVELPCFANQAAYLFLWQRGPVSAARSKAYPLLEDSGDRKVEMAWRCRYDRQTVVGSAEQAAEQHPAHLHRLRRRGIWLNREDVLKDDVTASRHWVAF